MGDEVHAINTRILQEIHAMVSQMYATETAARRQGLEAVQSLPVGEADMHNNVPGAEQETKGAVPKNAQGKIGALHQKTNGNPVQPREESLTPPWIPAHEADQHMNAVCPAGNANGEDRQHRHNFNENRDFNFENDEAGDALVDTKAAKLGLKEPDSLASVFLLDESPDVPPYSVETFYHESGMSQKIARSLWFTNLTVFVVVLNAIYLGIESDHNDASNIFRASWFFQVCSHFFCTYFTGELLVRFLAFKKKRNCLQDGWFKFDTFLVTTMILDNWVLMPTLYSMGGSMKIPTQPLRMLRLFKLTRMARLMRAFPELVTMIKGLIASCRATSSSLILVGLMLYVWAILIHMLLRDENEYNDMNWEKWKLGFGTLTQCMWTLFINGTLLLDNTQPLLASLIFHDKWNFFIAGMAFLSYLLLSALLILQMLIGVLCEVVAEVNQQQRDANALGLLKQELLGQLTAAAGDDGRISQEELLATMTNPSSRALFQRLNINLTYLLELQRMMFSRPGQSVSIKATLQLMVMCRGDNVTTVETLAGGLLSIIHEINALKDTFEESVASLERRVSSVPPAVVGSSKDYLNVATLTDQKWAL